MICGPYCGIRNHNRVLHFAQTFTLCQEIEAGVNELKRAGSDDDNIELITLEIDYLGGDFFFSKSNTKPIDFILGRKNLSSLNLIT